MLLPEFRKDSKLVLIVPTPKQFVMFSVPAILYTVNNNLVVHIQAYVDPASFQVRYYLETFNFKPSFKKCTGTPRKPNTAQPPRVFAQIKADRIRSD